MLHRGGGRWCFNCGARVSLAAVVVHLACLFLQRTDSLGLAPGSKVNMSWKGRVIARLLHEPDQVAQRLCPKPSARIDPSLLQPRAGPRRYRRPRNQVCAAVDDSTRQGTAEAPIRETSKNVRAVLEVLIYERDDDASDPFLELNMDRDAAEPAMKTLQRMQLSIARKLHGKQSPPLPKPSLPSFPPTLRPSAGSVHKNLASSETFTACHMCQLAVKESLAIDLTLPSNQALTLWVESCPPTIVAVRTFEDFDSCLFVEVPVVVSVELLFATRCRVDWYVNGALAVRDSPSFVPTAAHIGAHLSVLLTPLSPTHDGDGCQEAYQFRQTVQPLVENTVLTLRPTWTRPRTDGGTGSVRVVTYNVLADQNAFQQERQVPFYPYVSAEVLSRKRRLPLVLHELLAYHAEILCLQEVDELVYDTLLRPVLEHMGYSGTFSCKQTAGTREGCALFWNSERLELISDPAETTVSLRDLVGSALRVGREEDAEWRDLGTIACLLHDHPPLRDTMIRQLGHVAQMAHLVDRSTATTSSPPKSLWVVNTHLFYHPLASHVRLIQMYLIARELDRRRRRAGSLNGVRCGVPPSGVVVCGDWNSSLENAAGKLLVDRRTPTNFRDLQRHLNSFEFERQEVADDNDEPEPLADPTGQRRDVPGSDDFPAIELAESFPMLSSALSSPAHFTHWVEGFVGCLDHIVVSTDTLESLGSAPMPSEYDVTRDVAMPSAHLPSDHVCLVCDLAWR